MDHAELEELFGGKAGEQVPQVDPEDIKALWERGQQAKRDNPNGGTLTALPLLQHLQARAIIKAVIYRATKIEILRALHPRS